MVKSGKLKKVLRRWNRSLVLTFRKEEQMIYDLNEGDILEISFRKVDEDE